MTWRNPVSAVRERPFQLDVAVAVVLAIGSEIALFVTPTTPGARRPDALGAILALATAIPLAWRREHPRAALRVVGLATLLAAVVGYRMSLDGLTVLIALYSFAAYRREGSEAWSAAVIGIAIMATIFAIDVRSSTGAANSNYAWAGVVFILAWVVGDHLRGRRIAARRLEERADRAEHDRQLAAERAVLAERTRIARELHDVVAHALGVIAMQAAGAQRTPNLDPGEATSVLASIAETSRRALTDMRQMVGVLRADDAETELVPQPTVGDLPGLVHQLEAAGVSASLSVEGVPREVPAGVELSAYRIVQEALTNTLKHAGPARAQVTVRWCRDELEVEITDDGRGAAAFAPTQATPSDTHDDITGGGHGLIGMRERVSLYGGDLAAGPRPGGGFGVRARIPLRQGA